MVTKINQQFGSDAKANTIFGALVTSGDFTIIPTGQVWRAVAGGGGGSTADSVADGAAAGALRVQPLGFIELSPSGARFVHFSEWRRIAAALSIALGVGLFLGLRLPLRRPGQ